MFVTVKTVNGGKFGNGTRYKPVERGNMSGLLDNEEQNLKSAPQLKNF